MSWRDKVERREVRDREENRRYAKSEGVHAAELGKILALLAMAVGALLYIRGVVEGWTLVAFLVLFAVVALALIKFRTEHPRRPRRPRAEDGTIWDRLDP
ncbi:MAG: hypothetical protein AAGD14_13585 [Planctomycetota bacterium]